MPLEIDMLDVGNADAIVIQVYDDYDHKTILIDGGNTSDGSRVVSHVEKWTPGTIDLLINTHPDADHVDGLHRVVDELTIGHAFIHDPTAHHENARSLMRQLRNSDSDIARAVYKSLSSANDLISLLDSKLIPRSEPFTGQSVPLPDNSKITIVGPTEEFYGQLLEEMEATLGPSSPERQVEDLKAALAELREDQVRSHAQTPEEVLDEKNDESPSNNSSVLTLLTYRDNLYLFTGDAGPNALEMACQSYALRELKWLQIPHHGSRRNLTSGLVDHFSPQIAYVSAKGGEDDKHPNSNVVQALKNVECTVYGTNKSGSLWHHRDSDSEREGYSTATPL